MYKSEKKKHVTFQKKHRFKSVQEKCEFNSLSGMNRAS